MASLVYRKHNYLSVLQGWSYAGSLGLITQRIRINYLSSKEITDKSRLKSQKDQDHQYTGYIIILSITS